MNTTDSEGARCQLTRFYTARAETQLWRACVIGRAKQNQQMRCVVTGSNNQGVLVTEHGVVHMTGAIAALCGVDSDAVVALLEAMPEMAQAVASLGVGFPPTLDAVVINVSQPSVEAALAVVAHSGLSTEVLEQRAAQLVELATLPDVNYAIISTQFLAGVAHVSVELDAWWPPIIADDALDIVGDPQGMCARFIERFMVYDGYASIALLDEEGSPAWAMIRHTEYDPQVESDAILAATMQTLKEVLEPSLGVDPFTRHAAAFLRFMAGLSSRTTSRHVDVRLRWREGVAPHAVEVRVYDVRVDEVTAFLVETGQRLERYANIGAFLGLAEVEPDGDGHRWFRDVRVIFGVEDVLAIEVTMGVGSGAAVAL